MVLKVDLQCYRCYQKVKKVLCKYPGKDQKYDEKANTVTITVVSIDPQCIKTKISRKAGSCIKSIEIKSPEKKAPTETKDKDQKPPKKEPDQTKIVWILCKVCNTWHPEGPCNQTIYIPLPLAKACNENCGKKMCCNGCGGSGCKGCLGQGWISWYCAAARLHVKVAAALLVADAATGRPGHAAGVEALLVEDAATGRPGHAADVEALLVEGVAQVAAADHVVGVVALFRLHVRGAAAFGARVVVVVVDHVVVGGAAVVMKGMNVKRQLHHHCRLPSPRSNSVQATAAAQALTQHCLLFYHLVLMELRLENNDGRGV
ncbi:keratin, ultra high-sulfur matrix protein-like [Gossypium australe]|uniref:Keratin, ultra high-sulfur matrix protein-like n=1 Tax=Gossypium australe TaxID=47621 RepID=A0A5B6WAC7_9ROSI|nr:keratin, ultra high-sulfur matrix protein-like [Gossypium australe]